jgi:pimeloyl-ACP methyl ester carboxylesterase
MEGVGHFPMVEAPDRFNRLLADVIAGFPIEARPPG